MTSAAPQINYPALIATVVKAIADVRANKPLALPTPVTGADVAAALAAVQADIPILIAKIKAYPGVLTGLDDMLEALGGMGQQWAIDLKAALDALPGGLAEAQTWIPMIAGILTAFAPAPASSPIGGVEQDRGR